MSYSGLFSWKIINRLTGISVTFYSIQIKKSSRKRKKHLWTDYVISCVLNSKLYSRF